MTVITLFLSLLSGVVLSRLRGIGHEVQDKVMCIYYSHGINLLDIFSSTEQNTQMQPLLLSSNCGFFLQNLLLEGTVFTCLVSSCHPQLIVVFKPTRMRTQEQRNVGIPPTGCSNKWLEWLRWNVQTRKSSPRQDFYPKAKQRAGVENGAELLVIMLAPIY